jgi:uncharacterized protein YcfJ
MKIFGVLIAALLLPPCLPAFAQDNRPPASQPPESVHYGWADVLRVDPVYDDAGPPPSAPPREECYEEQTEISPPPPDNRAGSTVLGAIVGGVIGHSFGKGSGRAATTAAGAVAGAAIGNSVADAGQQGGSGYTTERHCRIVDSAGGSRHIVAYDIEYRYRGELYTSRMNYDPGDRLRVRITVTPAE